MKKHISLLALLISIFSIAQNGTPIFEKYPVFPECTEVSIENLQDCFNNTLEKFIFEHFITPEVVISENYTGKADVFFEVNKEGNFKVLYIDGIYNELKDEVRRVFDLLPKINPATYNGNPAYVQFTVSIKIPLKPSIKQNLGEPIIDKDKAQQQLASELLKNEYDSIENLLYSNEEYKSNINIPLSHHNYSVFEPALNRIGQNNHTAQKPYLYNEIDTYYNFELENQKLLKSSRSWLGRKWWNEHFVDFKGEDYWFTLDPGLDLQLGKDIDTEVNTYNNTRLVHAQGGLGKSIGFSAVVYESQGRFANYFNEYAESIRPDGGNPAIIPGLGIAKKFKTDSYDYPMATGHISYTPSKWFNIQLGHGKIFIGDGYRSLFLSDNASPYPFFKINTTFWKLKYTNTWMSLRDVRSDVTTNGSFRTKFMASHYLSYNVLKRLNIGLFESVLWQNDNDRGFDFNYMNPIIFYRAIEFSTGSRGGNALIGLSAKYKLSDRVNLYGQFIIDEFSSGDVFGGEGSYKNKTGYQIGAKYYDAFGVKNLYLQGEYNRVRPFTYSHNTIVLNYGHNNQSMAHTLGANFWEFVGIARYQHNRIFADAKLIWAKRGLEISTEEGAAFYGGNIYGDEDNRIMTIGNEIGQGNTTDFLHIELQSGYLINPASNLKVYGSFIFRDFTPSMDTETNYKNKTSWINFGIRTDLFNWYYDF